MTGQLCARARFWASLRLDGELSELEGALLDAHLAHCAACREVAGGFAAATVQLRAEPLAPAVPVTLPARRSPHRVLAGAAVAAVLAAAVVAGGLVRGHVSSDAAQKPHVVAVVASVETADQLRRLRRTSLLNMRPIPPELAVEPV